MEQKRNLQKNLYAVGYAESGRYVARAKVVANEEEKAIQTLYANHAMIHFVKLEEHYEPV